MSIILEDVLQEIDRGIKIARGRRNKLSRKLIWDIISIES